MCNNRFREEGKLTDSYSDAMIKEPKWGTENERGI